jgi:hypothetical protein
MPAPDHETRLRRLVTQLAQISPEDLALVLDELTTEQRSRAEALLSAYAQAGSLAQPVRDDAVLSQGRQLGLSPWLLDRLEDAAGNRAPTEAGPAFLTAPMTAASAEALQAAVREVWAQNRGARSTGPPGSRVLTKLFRVGRRRSFAS